MEKVEERVMIIRTPSRNAIISSCLAPFSFIKSFNCCIWLSIAVKEDIIAFLFPVSSSGDLYDSLMASCSARRMRDVLEISHAVNIESIQSLMIRSDCKAQK